MIVYYDRNSWFELAYDFHYIDERNDAFRYTISSPDETLGYDTLMLFIYLNKKRTER